jgi:hypothetical protein
MRWRAERVVELVRPNEMTERLTPPSSENFGNFPSRKTIEGRDSIPVSERQAARQPSFNPAAANAGLSG